VANGKKENTKAILACQSRAGGGKQKVPTRFKKPQTLTQCPETEKAPSKLLSGENTQNSDPKSRTSHTDAKGKE